MHDEASTEHLVDVRSPLEGAVLREKTLLLRHPAACLQRATGSIKLVSECRTMSTVSGGCRERRWRCGRVVRFP